MHSFVVRITLRQHVPLRAGVQNPKHRFKNQTRRNRLAAPTAVGNVLFRKMLPDAFPFRIKQSNHPPFYSGSTPTLNFEIGSTHSSRSPSATTAESDLRTKFLDAVEVQWPGSTRIPRLIARHDEWLKKKHTDGRSWYDIITDTLDENWQDRDRADEYIHDDAE